LHPIEYDRTYFGRLRRCEGDLPAVQVSPGSRLDECLLLVRFLFLVLVLLGRQTLQLGVDGVVHVIVGVTGGDVQRRQCYDKPRDTGTR